MRMNREIDVRNILAATRVPTLIVHRTADPLIEAAHGRYLAQQIPDAQYVEREAALMLRLREVREWRERFGMGIAGGPVRVARDPDAEGAEGAEGAEDTTGEPRIADAAGGASVELTLDWDDGSKGHYTGKLAHGPFTPPPQGFLRGDTKDLNNPGSTATWESEGRVFQVA